MKRFLIGVICLAGCGNHEPAALMASQSFALFDPVARRIASEPMDFSFTNTGGTRTPPLRVVKTGDPQFLIVDDSCEVALDSDKTCHVSIALDGADAGSFDGQLRVFAPPLLDAEVRLSGKVLPPELQITGTTTALSVPAGHAPPPAKFTIWNVGAGTTGSIALSGSAGFRVAGECVGRTLAGGASCDFTATYDKVKLDDPAETRHEFVAAAATPGGLSRTDIAVEVTLAHELSSDSPAFPDVLLSESSRQTFTITNPGPSPLSGVKLSVAEDGVPAPAGPSFSLIAETCTTGAPIESFASCSVTIDAVGRQRGVTTGVLTVSADDYKPAQSRLTVMVR